LGSFLFQAFDADIVVSVVDDNLAFLFDYMVDHGIVSSPMMRDVVVQTEMSKTWHRQRLGKWDESVTIC